MPRRSRSREVALQILFEDDINPRDSAADMQAFIRARLRARDLEEFALSLILGVRQNLETLDQLIEESMENWSIKRMAPTDRIVMRLGAYEMLHTDTPGKVAINEALELAKRFGSAQSSQFINGVLDKILSRQKKES